MYLIICDFEVCVNANKKSVYQSIKTTSVFKFQKVVKIFVFVYN